MNFEFFMPVRVISGERCMERGAQALKAISDQCLIVTGASSAQKSGALEDAEEMLKRAGIRYEIFDRIGQNPLVSVCREAGDRARRIGAGFVFGIGGGSALDAAKSVAVFAANPGISDDDFFAMKFGHRPLPVILAGTTAGTGSEVTKVSVLTRDGINRKQSITHPDCYARIAFANPRYTDTCPYAVTVSTALDALSHSLEGYYALRGSDTTAAFARKAVSLILPQLQALRNHPEQLPDAEGRDALYYGSLWAGLTLNMTGTGFPHPAGYILTSAHAVPHGRACAYFLPDYLRHNYAVNEQLSRQLFDGIGGDLDSLCALITELADLIGPRPKLTPEQCREYAELLRGKSHLENAVNPSTCEEILGYYEANFR